MSYAWHLHHSNRLLEPLTEPIAARRQYICTHKPLEEQALRLRLLKAVKGRLPLAYLHAWAAYERAETTYERAVEAYNRAETTYKRAVEAYNRAYESCLPKIEALHEKECQNCPWDGHTIFPKGDS